MTLNIVCNLFAAQFLTFWNISCSSVSVLHFEFDIIELCTQDSAAIGSFAVKTLEPDFLNLDLTLFLGKAAQQNSSQCKNALFLTFTTQCEFFELRPYLQKYAQIKLSRFYSLFFVKKKRCECLVTKMQPSMLRFSFSGFLRIFLKRILISLLRFSCGVSFFSQDYWASLEATSWMKFRR